MILVSKDDIISIAGYRKVELRGGRIYFTFQNDRLTKNYGEKTEAAFEAIKSALKQNKKTLDMDEFIDAPAEEAPAEEATPEAPAEDAPAENAE